MRTYLIRAILSIAVVLVVSAPAAAQGLLRGKVVDAAGKPIEGATITIEAADGSRKTEVKTNRSGEFAQIGLRSGRYKVTARKDNLAQALNVSVSQGTPAEASFQLTETSGLTPEQIKQNQAVQALAKEAMAAMDAGRDDEAIQKFNEILTTLPTCGDCHYNLGVAYARKQQYAEAEAAFQKAVELMPKPAAAYSGLAQVYNSQKKFDLAAQASAKAAELSATLGGSDNADALYNQGVIFWNAGKFAEAKEQFEKAVAANPNMAMAHYQLGMANLNLGQIPAARQAFEAYLKVEPNGPKSAEVQTFLKQLPQ